MAYSRKTNKSKKVPWASWSKEAPKGRLRTKMLRNCGRKCFLGPKKSFPICRKNTCKISSKGLWAAYIRSRQWGKKQSSYKGKSRPTMKQDIYKKIANKSKRMLNKRGFKVGKSRTNTKKRTLRR